VPVENKNTRFGIGMVRSIPTCTVDGHQSRGSKSKENHAKYDTTNPAAIRWVIHRVNRTGTGEPPVSPRSLTISSSLRCAVVSEDQDAGEGDNVQHQAGDRHTILQREPSQPLSVLAGDEKGDCRHEAECQEKAESVDELSRVCSQMGVDLLVLED
jgi:hypothetical protein